MSERRLLLLRHGESVWNAEGRWQGWADPPLSEDGRSAARVVARDLARFGFGAVVSSDLQRARETATIIGEVLGVPLSAAIPDLRERHVGEFTGKVTSEIEAMYPGWIERSRSGEWADHPGSEPYADFLERILRGVREAAMLDSPVLTVTHGGVLRALSIRLGLGAMSAGNLSGFWVEWGDRGLGVTLADFRYGGASEGGEQAAPPPL